MANDTPLLTPQQAAIRLGVSRPYIYKMVSTGVLTAIKWESTVRIDPSDLDTFIENRRTKSIPLKEIKVIPCGGRAFVDLQKY